MENLLIVGAGGFGRELYGIARECNGFGERFIIKGFLDDNPDALNGFNGYPPIVGSPESYVPQTGDVFITAIGSITARRRCAETLERHNAKFVSLVHRTASLGVNVEIGNGTLIAQNSFISADVRIGRHACIFQSVVVGHDTVLGNFAHVYALCSIGGEVKIGDGAAVYPGARIVPRRTIGNGAVVGIGSVVMLNVSPGTTVFGNPAAPMGHVFSAGANEPCELQDRSI